jgi:hypothetical protein
MICALPEIASRGEDGDILYNPDFLLSCNFLIDSGWTHFSNGQEQTLSHWAEIA